MHPSIEQLLKVQEIDSQLIFLKEAIRKRPLEIQDEKKKRQAAQERLDALNARVKELKMIVDRSELEIKSFDQEIAKITTAQNQARSNEEYTIFKEQIKRQSAQRSQAEEEVLERLSEIDDFVEQRGELEASLAQAERALERKQREIDEVVVGMTSQAQELESRRVGLLEGIKPDHLTIYERVLARHNDFAIALVEGQVCQGCHMAITPQEVNLLMTGGFLQCKNCSRLLYLED